MYLDINKEIDTNTTKADETIHNSAKAQASSSPWTAMPDQRYGTTIKQTQEVKR
jgi:hypothetical protein